MVAPGCADVAFASSWSVPGYPMSVTALRIEGEHGVLEVDNDTVRLELHRACGDVPAGALRLTEADLPQPAGFYFNGEAYALEDAHVLRWVSGGPAPPITAAAGLRVQRLMAALYASAAAGGTTVAVPT
jgi:predicted dehydrogenase